MEANRSSGYPRRQRNRRPRGDFNDFREDPQFSRRPRGQHSYSTPNSSGEMLLGYRSEPAVESAWDESIDVVPEEGNDIFVGRGGDQGRYESRDQYRTRGRVDNRKRFENRVDRRHFDNRGSRSRFDNRSGYSSRRESNSGFDSRRDFEGNSEIRRVDHRGGRGRLNDRGYRAGPENRGGFQMSGRYSNPRESDTIGHFQGNGDYVERRGRRRFNNRGRRGGYENRGRFQWRGEHDNRRANDTRGESDPPRDYGDSVRFTNRRGHDNRVRRGRFRGPREFADQGGYRGYQHHNFRRDNQTYSSPSSAPLFTKVDSLEPEQSGVDLKCVVLGTAVNSRTITTADANELKTWEVLVGDETGCILGWFMGDMESVLGDGQSLVIRGGRIVMKQQKNMRLLVNKRGSVEGTEPLNVAVKKENNLSLIEYEVERP